MAILLVDDEPAFTYAVGRNLRNEGWEILTAKSGAEALEVVKNRADVQILATDFNMPGMDGAQLINRALALQPDLYTIVFTGWEDRDYAIRSLRVGADEFLDKTSDIDVELRRSIRKGTQQLTIARMGRELLQRGDDHEIIETVLNSFSALKRFDGICLATRESGTNTCKVERAVDLQTGDPIPEGHELGENSAYRFVIERRNVYYPPVFAPKDVDLTPYLDDTQSIIVVPFIYRSHERGALGIEDREAGKFGIEDLRFIRQAADWISMAMERLTNLDRVYLEKSRGKSDRGLLARSLLHELKNPLNNLSTAVEVVMETVQSEELDGLYEELDGLYDNIHRMNRVIERFLKPLIREEKEPGPIDVPHALSEAITRIRLYDPANTPRIECEVESLIPQIDGSREMLIAAFVNLLENATKAIRPNGRISVRVFFVPVREQVEILIIDDGKGIAAEDLPKIFDYGFSTGGEGEYGYGLALTHDIVQRHGGEISVQTAEGKGTTFKLSFPASQLHAGRRETR